VNKLLESDKFMHVSNELCIDFFSLHSFMLQLTLLTSLILFWESLVCWNHKKSWTSADVASTTARHVT